MLNHLVLFWTKDGLSDADRADFEQGLRSLLQISVVEGGSVGTPAATNRPNVDRSYAFALMLRFKNVTAHDAYQIDPIHNAFHARCEKYWQKVAVYDFG
ncbi:MAG: Dabb family protein [Polyangia bacterium]